MSFTTSRGHGRRRAPAALLVVLALGLAACGSDDDDPPTTAATSASATAASASATSAPAASESSAPAASESSAPAATGSATASASGAATGTPESIAAAAAKAAADGLLFITSHEEIVTKAKEEGEVNAFVSADNLDLLDKGFAEATGLKVKAQDFSGGDAYTRFLLEAEAGAVKNSDVMQSPPEVYAEFNKLMAPYDIYGMAEQGILNIPLAMIDPVSRRVAAVGTQLGGIAWNPKLIDEASIPTTWEGFCDPAYLKGQPFFLDVRPTNSASLVAEWGEERVQALMKCIMAAKPTLVRGSTETLTRLGAGEGAVMLFNNYHSCIDVAKDAPDTVKCGLIDPVPVRMSNALGVLNDKIAKNPHAALLFIEWMATPEAQKVLDMDPLKSSIHVEGTETRKAIGDKSFSGGAIDDYLKMDVWMEDIGKIVQP